MDIKNLREKTGMSQGEFAKTYSIPVKTLQHWEAERRKPAPYLILLLERAVEEDLREASLQEKVFPDKKQIQSDIEAEIKMLMNKVSDCRRNADFNSASEHLLVAKGLRHALNIICGQM